MQQQITFTKTQEGDISTYTPTNSNMVITFNSAQKCFTIIKSGTAGVNLDMLAALKNQYPELPISINKGRIIILKEYSVNFM